MSVNLTEINELRKNGQHAEAKEQLVKLAAQYPDDYVVQYEAACVHDYLGLERDAIPFYLKAIQKGLSGDALRNTYLGLGSTYRALGMYKESKQTFIEGLQQFPEAAEIKVFMAMTQYNLGEHHEAVANLLNIIADTTSDTEIKSYKRAIREYAENLDRTWDE
jgi:tetratricopeptide (TPR) repeat protein